MSSLDADRMKILVAEDSATERLKLSGLLSSWGYQVYEASDGLEAWELFDRHGFSFVLSDWQMPGLSGIELTGRIRRKENTGIVYVVLLTARSGLSDEIMAMEHGADAFLTKPAVPEELRARIHAGERILRLEKKLERRSVQLMETQARLFEAEKLEGIAQLAAGMAHEINNPLSIVSGSLDNFALAFGSVFELTNALEDALPEIQTALPETHSRLEAAVEKCGLQWIRQSTPRLLESAQTGIRRVQDIVTQLRSFVHDNQAQIDCINPVNSVRTTIRMLTPELDSSRVKVDLTFEKPMPTLTCSPARFNQAIYNVLRNAIQASPVNGTIAIHVGCANEQIQIRIEDEGPGIPEGAVSRIFEPFYTSRDVGGGQGLGLSFSRRIIEDHQGAIACSTRPGGGTVFEITVPVRQDNSAACSTV